MLIRMLRLFIMLKLVEMQILMYDLIVVNDMPGDIASQFKKHLKEDGGVERKKKVRRYQGDGPNCRDVHNIKW